MPTRCHVAAATESSRERAGMGHRDVRWQRRPTVSASVQYSLLLTILIIISPVLGQKGDFNELARVFNNCRKRTPTFDDCVKEGLNSIRHLFKRGLPELNVASFDPHMANEVVQQRGGPGLKYRLRLTDVSEYGWSDSFVDRFKSDLDNNRIEYSQYFPEKWLKGEYDFDALMLQFPVHNRGVWNLTLYDYNQTTVIFRRPVIRVDGSTDFKSGPLRVQVRVTHIGNMALHISNLLRGRKIMEDIVDRTLNAGAWRAGLPMFLPLVNDLVSSAFTEIFNKSFRYFPIDAIFPE